MGLEYGKGSVVMKKLLWHLMLGWCVSIGTGRER